MIRVLRGSCPDLPLLQQPDPYGYSMGPKKFHENFDKKVFSSSFAPFFFCFIVQLVILQILFKGS